MFGKRMLALLLALSLLILCAPAALAAQDITFTEDKTISPQFTMYGDFTVKSGAHVVIRKSAGFEISGSIIVETGASLTGEGPANGDYTFTMRGKDADIVGIPLYYRLEAEDGSITVREIKGGYRAVTALDGWDWSGGWCPRFEWETSVQGWCLTGTMRGNPFNEYFYHKERDMNAAKMTAGALNRLGLFKGVGSKDGQINFDLERPANRLEALVMLIRLLGKEDEALNGQWEHPFTDASWATQYVGYAYANGLTNGVSDTKFGTGEASAQMYLTFLLRALGYTDADTGSTVWDEAVSMADRLGILTAENDDYKICLDDFWRADMVLTSHRALSRTMRSGRPLYEKLIEDGVFTEEQYRNQ